MEIISGQSNLNHARFAVQQVVLQLKDIQPDFMVIAGSPASHFKSCSELLSAHYPRTQMIGCSSHDGIMTEQGFCQSEIGCSFGAWALADSKGCYGVALSHGSENIEATVNHTLDQALSNAGRMGELPTLIWLHSATEHEEKILRAIGKYLGDNVPVVGGSAATNRVDSDEVAVIACNLQHSECGFALAVLFPSGRVGYSFHSGCTVVEPLGLATEVKHKELIQIDHRPALEMYEQVLGASLQEKISESQWSDIPIGRLVGVQQNLPMFTLTLPLSTHEQGIHLATPVQKGERLFLMKGSRQGLNGRSKRVLSSAMEMLPEGRLGLYPIGALIVYCACCMQDQADDMEQECQDMAVILGEQTPYLTMFTAGEQGPLLHAQNIHGNLMIASVVFYGQARYG